MSVNVDGTRVCARSIFRNCVYGGGVAGTIHVIVLKLNTITILNVFLLLYSENVVIELCVRVRQYTLKSKHSLIDIMIK